MSPAQVTTAYGPLLVAEATSTPPRRMRQVIDPEPPDSDCAAIDSGMNADSSMVIVFRHGRRVR